MVPYEFSCTHNSLNLQFHLVFSNILFSAWYEVRVIFMYGHTLLCLAFKFYLVTQTSQVHVHFDLNSISLESSIFEEFQQNQYPSFHTSNTLQAETCSYTPIICLQNLDNSNTISLSVWVLCGIQLMAATDHALTIKLDIWLFFPSRTWFHSRTPILCFWI